MRRQENLSYSMTMYYSRPAFVANRFNESSLSPIARTWPHSANCVVVPRARPSVSTSAMAIWTAAWSLEVIRRSMVHEGDKGDG